MPKATDFQGLRFGRLIVTGPPETTGSRAKWPCLCDCGKPSAVRADALKAGRTRSCGCYGKERQVAGVQKALAARGCRGGLHSHLYEYKWKATRRGLSWELTDDQALALMMGDCNYCGSPPATEVTKVKALNKIPLRNGIDRTDNALGYTVENSVSCCKRCNIGKTNSSKQDFLSWVSRIAQHQGFNTFTPPPTQEDNTMKWAVQ